MLLSSHVRSFGFMFAVSLDSLCDATVSGSAEKVSERERATKTTWCIN